ncbi:KICSTOR subunit 2 [Hydra vulgaris]|uniref:KICSTOR subunit 2 n=1 Tax=Hydra vulgaris TaxID=6087 RepID=A0ABM4BEV6_HYDVU
MEFSLKPIPRERALLETFFCTLANFHFDQARESIEREKEESKHEPETLYTNLLSCLIPLPNIEKGYFMMLFVERRLLRRETIKPLYLNLLSDLKKHVCVDNEDALHGIDAISFDLSKQLVQFINARICMIDFYESLVRTSWSHTKDRKLISIAISEIISKFNKEFHHPMLDPLKISFTTEVDVVQCLMRLEIQLAEWDFFESFLLLRECHSKINSWFVVSTTSDLREQLFFNKNFFRKKNVELPFLYEWLNRFYELLISKFAFYFHTTLSSHILQQEKKTLLSRLSVDYVTKLTDFQKKSGAFCISLVLDASKKASTYCGHGYHLPSTIRSPPTGMNSYPSVLNIPDVNIKEHWPNIISMINDNSMTLNVTDKIVHVYDSMLQSSYFLIKVDLLMTLVVTYNTKKKEKDSYVTSILSEIRSQLDLDKLYLMLKNQQKSFNQ